MAQAVEDAAYAVLLVGRTLFEAEEWGLAARQLERATSHNGDYASAHAYLGHALDRMGYSAEAESHLLHAVRLEPDSPVPHTFLGLHHEREGEISAARASYETAYDLDPENPGICVEIGQAWAAEGRYEVAEIWLREAVSLAPQNPTLLKILVRFYLDNNIVATGRAVEETEKLVELLPDDARAHDLRGWAALQVGEHDVAREHLHQAIELDPRLASAHYHLGLLWNAEGAHERAREAFIRALDLDTTGALVPLIERMTAGEIDWSGKEW